MTGFLLIFLLSSVFHLPKTAAEISDKRLCADQQCSEAISTARTLLRYSAPEKGMLSFGPNEQITVYSKSAGRNSNLWGAERGGVRGYVPKNYLREEKVFKKELRFLVDTEFTAKEVPSDSIDVKPDKAETIVVDGTTIYQNDISPSIVNEVVPTAVPFKQASYDVEEDPEEDDGVIEGEDEDEEDGEDEDDDESDEITQQSKPPTFEEGEIPKAADSEQVTKEESSKTEIKIDGIAIDTKESSLSQPSEINENSNLPPSDSSSEQKVDTAKPLDVDKKEQADVDNKEPVDIVDSKEQVNIVDDVQGDTKEQEPSSTQQAEGLESINVKESIISDGLEGTKQEENKAEPSEEQNTLSTPPTENPTGETEKAQNEESGNFFTGGGISSFFSFNPAPENTETTSNEQSEDNKNVAVEGLEKIDSNVLPVEQTSNQDSSSTGLPSGELDSGNGVPVQAPQTTHSEGSPIVTSYGLPVVAFEGSPAVSSEATPTGSSDASPTASFEALPTVSSEGSPTASFEALPTLPSEGSPTTSFEALPTVPSEGSPTASFEALPTVPSTIPEALPTQESLVATTEGTVLSEGIANISSEEPLKADGSQTTFPPSETTNLESESSTVSIEELTNTTQDKVVTFEEASPEILPFAEETLNVPPADSSEQLSPPAVQSFEQTFPSHPPEISAQPNNLPSMEYPANINAEAPKYEQNLNAGGGFYKPSFYPRAESNEQQTVQHNNNEHQNVANTPVDVLKETPYIPEEKIEEQVNTEAPGIAEVPDITEAPVKTDEGDVITEEEKGFWSGFLDMFSGGTAADEGKAIDEGGYVESDDDVLLSRNKVADATNACTSDPSSQFCSGADKPTMPEEDSFIGSLDLHSLLYFLGISGTTVVVFLWGYIIIDKMRKEGPLIAKINNLEKVLLVTKKENQILAEKLSDNTASGKETAISNEIIEELRVELEESNTARFALEEQVQSLEKELENSTEVGLELNRMLSDVLSSQNGSETLMSNIEQLQNKLVEQQSIINTLNSNVSEKETANHELQLELEINTKKVVDLQAELDKMVENLLKIEEEKDVSQNKYEVQIHELKSSVNKLKQGNNTEITTLKHQAAEADKRFKETQRNLELKINEYNLLKDNVKSLSGGNDVKTILDANSMKAELQQLQHEKGMLGEHLQQHQTLISGLEGEMDTLRKDLEVYRGKYEEADKEKLQVLTKLDVLNAYFKEREAELQKEIAKYESMWMEKQGEATSTVGRIKFMQEEIQNFKSQNESLKQEIISQEVELKGQISVLEKKAHENWVSARQAERKLEDVKQEAATLRNRLTLRERNMNEDKSQNRLQSPLESNGDHPLSPIHMSMESPASPPLLYGAPRDRMTTSPPLPGLPPMFPPPGVPFMPPPMHGMPPFMPPPPSMFPGDHRPPPLGRMSSPPLNSRYSPDSRYYDRNTPSPTDDEYYASSHRGYSPGPYNGSRDNRRDYGRNRSNAKKGGVSSGSANSNDSLDKINRHNSKV